VAFLFTESVEQVELTEPLKAVNTRERRPSWSRWTRARSRCGTTSTQPQAGRPESVLRHDHRGVLRGQAPAARGA